MNAADETRLNHALDRAASRLGRDRLALRRLLRWPELTGAALLRRVETADPELFAAVTAELGPARRTMHRNVPT